MKTILVVDDEYAVLDALAALLEDEGFRVVTAGNGAEGLDRLAQEKPDLVLLDVMMPKLDGREVVRIMKSTPAYADIPVLLMSAAERNSARVDDAPFLHKPFDITELLRRIEEALGKKS